MGDGKDITWAVESRSFSSSLLKFKINADRNQ